MAIFGEPDAELKDLLDEIDAIQQAGERTDPAWRARRRRFRRAGEVLPRIIARQLARIRRPWDGPHQPRGAAPHGSGPVPYPAYDADLPLQKGMVLSIETTILHPRRGFIKLEDTVAVTESGCEGFGDRGRGWNRCGATRLLATRPTRPPLSSPGASRS